MEDSYRKGNLLRLVRFTDAKVQKKLHTAIHLRLIIKSLTFSSSKFKISIFSDSKKLKPAEKCVRMGKVKDFSTVNLCSILVSQRDFSRKMLNSFLTIKKGNQRCTIV